jgi:hypothetical protein
MMVKFKPFLLLLLIGTNESIQKKKDKEMRKPLKNL